GAATWERSRLFFLFSWPTFLAPHAAWQRRDCHPGVAENPASCVRVSLLKVQSQAEQLQRYSEVSSKRYAFRGGPVRLLAEADGTAALPLRIHSVGRQARVQPNCESGHRRTIRVDDLIPTAQL